MPPSAPYPFVKVFGERGSGTNFLQQLIAHNFQAKIVPNISGPTEDQRALIQTIPEDVRRPGQIAERIADYHHIEQMQRNAGWKHARLTDQVFQIFRRAEKTLFLCILRHPALWLRSFAKNPYHGFSAAAADLDQFLATPWITRARDEVGPVLLESPVHLWRLKTESYLDQAERRANVLVLRHEDFLVDHEARLRTLSTYLPGAADKWTLPEAYARRWLDRARDFWSIRKDLPDDPFTTLSTDQVQHLRSRIGDDLIERAGYGVPAGGAE